VYLDWHRVLRLVVARQSGNGIPYAASFLFLWLRDLVIKIAQHRRGTIDNAPLGCRVPNQASGAAKIANLQRGGLIHEDGCRSVRFGNQGRHLRSAVAAGPDRAVQGTEPDQ
jgi:hypothetical protein